VSQQAFQIANAYDKGEPRMLRFVGTTIYDVLIAQDDLRLVFLLRISPVMPFSVPSYMLSLSSIDLRSYTVGTLASLPAFQPARRAARWFCRARDRLRSNFVAMATGETQNYPNGPGIWGMSANSGRCRLWGGCRNDMAAWLPTRCKFGFLRVVPVAS
jgi:hypothetical protein